MNTKQQLIVIGVFVGLLAGGMVLQKRQQDTSSGNQSTTTPTLTPTTKPAAVKGESQSSLKIEMTNFAFAPKELIAKPGETLTVNIVNVEGKHDFVVPNLGVKTRLYNPGETDAVTLAIPPTASPGTAYDFYCSPHRTLGMMGKIRVIDK